mmetsp:Transcript_6297/g.15892  ORF Transcript_6297/g.15892 Transcript_6297/m.15892 type:complete len:83 (+) Transcript_6297:555-803(+)
MKNKKTRAQKTQQTTSFFRPKYQNGTNTRLVRLNENDCCACSATSCSVSLMLLSSNQWQGKGKARLVCLFFCFSSCLLWLCA